MPIPFPFDHLSFLFQGNIFEAEIYKTWCWGVLHRPASQFKGFSHSLIRSITYSPGHLFVHSLTQSFIFAHSFIVIRLLFPPHLHPGR